MTGVVLGRPAKPYPEEVNIALTRAVSSVEGVAEAHFPQLWDLAHMERAEQTLIIVPGRDRDEQTVMEAVVAAVEKELGGGPQVLMIALNGKNGLISTVRGTGCQLYKSKTERPDRPWWCFW